MERPSLQAALREYPSVTFSENPLAPALIVHDLLNVTSTYNRVPFVLPISRRVRAAT
jgi:hypothetical protein